MNPVRVMLVEDNEVFREALELMLGMREEVEVVASVRDGSSALTTVREHRPDVVLIDYRMPGLDGVETTTQLRAQIPEVAVVASVGDGAAALIAVPENRPDVALVDYRMPGLDGVETTTELRTQFPEVAVVALTASANAIQRQQLLAAGAVACLGKDEELDEIVAAIQRAATT